MSVDGAFVPVVGGQWKEVKSLTLGTIRQWEGAFAPLLTAELKKTGAV